MSLTSKQRAKTPSRLGVARLGVTRLAWAPVDLTAAKVYAYVQIDPEPGVIAPPAPTTDYTVVTEP